MSKTINTPAYLAAIKREVAEMTDEQTKEYARSAMDSDRVVDAILEGDGETKEFDLCD